MLPVSMLMRLWIASAKLSGLRELPVCTGVGEVGDPKVLLVLDSLTGRLEFSGS